MTTQRRNRFGGLVGMAAFVVVVAGMKAASALIVPFLLAVFLAVICLPLLVWLKNKGVPQLLGLVVIVAMLIGVWTLVIILLGTTLADFTRNVPVYQQKLGEVIGEAYSYLQDHGIVVDRSMMENIFDPARLMRILASTLNSLGGMLTSAFVIFLMFAFLLMEAAGIPQKITLIRESRPGALDSYNAIITGINKYLAIKSVTSFFTGALIFVFLKFQGVDFPILWGMIAFLLNFIPNIGSLLAAVPPVLLALIQFGFGQALVTAGAFLAVNTVIGSIIEPRVMGQGVGLSTLVVFLSLIFWGWVLGPVGMLLSVPLTMGIKIALAEYDSTRWIAILLGSNREVAKAMEARETSEE
ncbi:MAG: AI-2E family transporter [Desulfofustis sp.]|nr:AI-2E family transporter [Desulfofustis sp.]